MQTKINTICPCCGKEETKILTNTHSKKKNTFWLTVIITILSSLTVILFITAKSISESIKLRTPFIGLITEMAADHMILCFSIYSFVFIFLAILFHHLIPFEIETTYKGYCPHCHTLFNIEETDTNEQERKNKCRECKPAQQPNDD